MRHESNSLNLSVVILIVINIVGLFVVKNQWTEIETGWTAQISKILYGVLILLMLPSMVRVRNGLILLPLICIISILISYIIGADFELGDSLKQLLVLLGFPYFYLMFRRYDINNKYIYVFLITIIVDLMKAILTANILENAIMEERFGTGQATSNYLILLIPLVCYICKPKYIGFIYCIILLGCAISMRRTAIIACFLCAPFVYSYIKDYIPKKYIYLAIIFIILGIITILSKYWFAFEARFSDMFEADRNGNYGSGRSGWFEVLYKSFINSENLLTFLFGFGQGSVKECMYRAGYPFSHAHCDYIQFGYTYGLVFLFFLYRLFVKSVIAAIRIHKENRKLVLMLLIAVCSLGLTSKCLGSPNAIVVPMTLFMIMYKRCRI